MNEPIRIAPRDGVWRLCPVGLKAPGMTDAEVRLMLSELKPRPNGLDLGAKVEGGAA